MNAAKRPNQSLLQVQFRHMPKSNAIFNMVQEEIAAISRLTSPDAHYEVVIDETHHRQHGGIYEVKIRMTVPGDRIYTAHGNEQSGSPDFIYDAISNAFYELGQQLKKTRKKQERRIREYPPAYESVSAQNPTTTVYTPDFSASSGFAANYKKAQYA